MVRTPSLCFAHQVGCTISRAGHTMIDVWEDGLEVKAIIQRQAELLQRKEGMEKRKRQLAKDKKAAASATETNSLSVLREELEIVSFDDV